MPFNLGGGELVFILVIVLIVFGAGKLPEVFGQLGKGVRTFREESTNEPKSAVPTSAATAAPAAKYCQKCGNGLDPSALFCPKCGTPVGGAPA